MTHLQNKKASNSEVLFHSCRTITPGNNPTVFLFLEESIIFL